MTAVVFAVDYLTGSEIRVYPLYFIPACLAAWHFGRKGAVLFSANGALCWAAANHLAGMAFSAGFIWGINIAAQAISLLFVTLLIDRLRGEIRRAEALSLADPLTGLPNSRAFLETAARELALHRRLGRPVLLAYADLDNFKLVNDGLGHAEGDAVLREFAAILRESLRESDLCARMGGDEFAMLLPGAGEGTRERLEQLRRRAEAKLRRGSISVTASVGAVLLANPPENLEAFLKMADALMYEAKSRGRNFLVFEER